MAVRQTVRRETLDVKRGNLSEALRPLETFYVSRFTFHVF